MPRGASHPRLTQRARRAPQPPAGMPATDIGLATSVATGVATFSMGMVANYPVSLGGDRQAALHVRQASAPLSVRLPAQAHGERCTRALFPPTGLHSACGRVHFACGMHVHGRAPGLRVEPSHCRPAFSSCMSSRAVIIPRHATQLPPCPAAPLRSGWSRFSLAPTPTLSPKF